MDKLRIIPYIFLTWIVILVILLFVTLKNSATTEKQPTKAYIRKKALNLMGEDFNAKHLKDDEGAKLMYNGIVQFLKEDFRDAASCFEEALKLSLSDNNRLFCFVWILRCYEALCYDAVYEVTIRRMLQALPANDKSLHLGGLYYANKGEYEKAVYYFEQAIKYYDTVLKINENDVFCICQKAVCYAALGDYEAAEKLTVRAAAFNADDFEMIEKKLEMIKKIRSGDYLKEEA